MRARSPAKPVPVERRKVARRAINRVAHYVSDGALPRSCMVTDISDSGARLFCETALPDSFVLAISGEGGARRRDCRVVWRLGGECGVAFTDRTRRV